MSKQPGAVHDRLLGGKPDSALILDESSFVKQGERSVGVYGAAIWMEKRDNQDKKLGS